jgi:hypothetical protein
MLREVRTRLGVVRLRMDPREPDRTRPVLFAIPGILSTEADIATLGANLGMAADLCIMGLPIARDTGLSSCAIGDLCAMVGELLEAQFADRAVILMGVSSGAVIALGVRAGNLVRVVALEPPLLTAGLWPVIDPLSEHLRTSPDPAREAFTAETFGVSRAGLTPRDHRWVLSGLSVPVDVVLGETPLQPQRELPRFPSLVDTAERRLLAMTPNVRLHIASGAGHNVLGQQMRAVHAVVLEACRRAAARLPATRLRVDEPLLEATPLTARRVLHWGPDGAAFAEAFARLNPLCETQVLGESERVSPASSPVDAVVLARPAPEALLPLFADALRPNGHLIARWAPEAAEGALATCGLALREPVDDAGTGVLRAQKVGPGAPPRPAMFVLNVAYASAMMDIRTRLPAQGLRSDPELRLAYEAPPFALPPLAFEAPKMVLLQRPAELKVEVWRPFLARLIREGWLAVMEYDDYPPLIAEVLGQPSSPDDLLRFGFVHAVQTATPALVEAFRTYNAETELFPNAVFDLAPYPGAPRRPRVFYGGVLRGGYAVEVARSLAPAFQRRPEAEVVVVGDRAVFEALPTERKIFHDYMSFEAYLEEMARCAVSLSPIEALPWRDTKSDAKFLDAARAGVLTIASPTIYERVIRHGENGLLARDLADWAPLLELALTDHAMRERLARNAWDDVRRTRMFANQVAQRRDWYLDLWNRRAQLNEALIARVPGLREAVGSG